MNERPGIKDEMLKVAKEIAAEQGVSSISIRTVATRCGISVGTVYNHFPDKGSLIATVIEDFWQGVFRSVDYKKLEELPTIDALEAFYGQLAQYLAHFKVNWLEQLSLLDGSTKQTGRERERKMFDRIIGVMRNMISKSQKVSSDYTEKELEKLSLFIFDNIMAMLRRGETDFTFARRILTKLLG